MKKTSQLPLDGNQLEELQKLIGYRFKNQGLLLRAMTHQSFVTGSKSNYQRLEFLGDSILDFIAAEYLCNKYPNADEGELTRMRANIVSKFPLASVANAMGLTDYLMVNDSSFEFSQKVYSDIIESICAAIYIDSGDIDCARRFIVECVISRIVGDDFKLHDFKSRLIELATAKNCKLEFKVLEQRGEPHNPIFKCGVYWNGKQMGIAEAKSKKTAEQECSRQALIKMKKI